MADRARAREGYFVIADISGYTAFLTGTELEHAQGIIAELLTLIIDALTPPLTLVRPEGDAVFCRADASVFGDAERLLELVEVAYFKFHQHLEQMARATTCTCAACASISTLDLKFVAHFGSYVVQQIAGGEDVAGADVITTHRLLKNSIKERTGCDAYVFLTDAVVARFASPPALATHAEQVEGIGTVSGAVQDLKPALAARRAAHRVYVAPDDADVIIEGELPAPPEAVWPWLVEPDKVPAWASTMVGFQNVANGQGRLGVGAESHCAHGSWDAVLRYLDWRPYEYFTTHLTPTKKSFSAAPPLTATTELSPLGDDRTMYRFRLRVDDRGLGMRVQLKLLGPFMRRSMTADVRKLASLIESARRDRDADAQS